MAWRENKVENQRKLFCEAVLNKKLSLQEGCRQFLISRPTGYLWLQRYKLEGEKGLINLSRARRTQETKTSNEIVNEILAVKHQYPTWGSKKILPKLVERYPALDWPCTTTISKILANNGLVKKRRVRRRLPINPSGLTESGDSNDVWCMDFKGWHLTKDNYKFDPFTLTDHYSRFLLRCLKLDLNNSVNVWTMLDIAFREYGLPKYIRSDNGPPFATCSPGRLSLLSIKLIKAGVIPEWIEPGNPQQNGRHERMHLTMEQEGFYPLLNLEEQSLKLESFQLYYNFDRPHEAIGQKTPGSVYSISDRVWNGKLNEIEYSNEYKIAKVHSCGKMSWKGKNIYIGRVFNGELLGIKENKVYFGPIFLGTLSNENEFEVERRDIRKRYSHKILDPK